LGIIGALSYKKDYLYFNNYSGIIEQFSKNASLSTDLKEEYGNEEVIWSALGGVTYKINAYNKVGVTLIRNQSGASGTRSKVGYREIYPGGSQARETSLEYVQRSISSVQLKGKHVIPQWNNFQIEWFGSSAYSVQNEPDMRFWYNTFSVSEEGDTSYNMIPNTQPLRYYRFMNEQDIHTSIHVTVPLDRIVEKANFKFGGDLISKDRLSQEYQYTLKTNFGSANFNGDPEEYVSDDRLVNADNLFDGGSIYYSSRLLTNDVYSYAAQEFTSSAFFMVDLPVSKYFRVVGGVKYEYNDVYVENLVKADSLTWQERYNPDWNTYTSIKNKYLNGEYTTRDWLPSLNLTFFLSDRTNLRLNYWKSISKPALREIAPLYFYDFLRGISFTGNADLERSINFNYDVRLEHFFNAGEMVSLSGFYKVLQNPIEIYAPAETENIEYIYRNGRNANIFGVETEIRKALDFISYTSRFQIGFNLTLVYSQIDEEADRLEEALRINPDFPTSRPMFGQAPYTLNSYLMYAYPEWGLEANLAYNVSGPKLIIISQAAAPNVYEMPFRQLDFNISKKITPILTIKLGVKNILNEAHKTSYVNREISDFSIRKPFQFIQSVETMADFRSYKSGTEYSIGLSMNF
jgi:TonB-dependent receptor